VAEENGGSVGIIRQQIGEILGTVRSQTDTLKEVQLEGLRREDRLAAELRNVKHEQRQNDQIWSAKLELLGKQIGEIDNKVKNLESLKVPMESFAKLRTYAVALMVIGMVIWSVFGPILQGVVAMWIGGRK